MKRIMLFLVLSGLCICMNAQCWKSVSAQFNHSAGVKQDGTLWHWGEMIGSSPVRIGNNSDWDKVYLTNDGLSFQTVFFAIKNDGSLWVNGSSILGQLGLGASITSTTGFTRIGTANDWLLLSEGTGHCIGLKTNGTIWAWGDNRYGQLGLGDFTNRFVPTQIGTGSDWNSLSNGKGGLHTLAIKNDGTLWGWGYNALYQLGLGHTNNQNIPTQIGIHNDWMAVSTHANQLSFGIRSGRLYTFGTGYYSGISGAPSYFTVPTQAGTATDWAFISGGYSQTIGTAVNNFTLSHKSWGDNSFGELGTGNFSAQQIPVPLSGNHAFILISSAHHNLALTPGGDLWVWGNNNYGQLGDNTTVNSNIPILIPCPSATLPVSLLSINTVKNKNGTLLNWQTATETNNNGFEIEKSTDGTSFSKIGFVSGTNNSTVTKQYQYTDTAICSGKQFYRLKQIDNNGNFKYSDVATVSCHNGGKIIVAPNPASSIVKIIAENVAIIKVFSNTGTLVTYSKPSAGNTYPIDVNKLPAGLYWVRLHFKDGKQATEKIQVIH